MGKSSGIFFLIIGIVALATVTIVIWGIILYNRYLNKRLKGETEKKAFINFRMFAVIMAFSLCAFTISYLGISLANMTNDWKNQRERLEQYENNPPRWSYTIEDFEKNPQYATFRNELISGTMTGFEISTKTDGDFECFVAFTTERVAGLPYLLPEYYIYVRYTGADLDDIMMERNYYYNQDHTVGVGSVGQFYEETLIVGNFGREDFYFGREEYYIEIETILKIAPQTPETKINWNTIPVFAQANFVIKNNELSVR